MIEIVYLKSYSSVFVKLLWQTLTISTLYIRWYKELPKGHFDDQSDGNTDKDNDEMVKGVSMVWTSSSYHKNHIGQLRMYSGKGPQCFTAPNNVKGYSNIQKRYDESLDLAFIQCLHLINATSEP